MDIDITELVRDYLVRFVVWANALTDAELIAMESVEPAGLVDAFLKEDQ
ncbi:hypothetical protein [Mycolicibacterium houstonense]|nr:hypothetical protein [Mycolicibacterium houstonense]